ncbi:MAG: helix-hairpin-helix domain-containing protein [Burkholderiaceae bacterium]
MVTAAARPGVMVGPTMQADPQPLQGSGDNAHVAELLRQAATLRAAQQDNRFRVAAYREAARRILDLPESVRAIYERGGQAALDALPAIGPGIAAAIAEILATGRWSQLERLRGEVDPTHVFQSIAGVGPELSQRIHDELQVDTLEALEAVAQTGRLEQVRGVGARRAAAIRAALAQLLERGRRSPRAPLPGGGPSVQELLALDADYRAKAAAGELPTIAPRRFNPEGRSWLPVWHTRRGRWHYTAMYSNTARAHELQREHDWVVIYFHDDDLVEHQCTVVTETRGPLQGERVVRGRELECRQLAAARQAPPPAPGAQRSRT